MMSDPLASFSTEELLKIKSGDVSGLSTEKLQLLRGILSQAPMFSPPDMPVAAAPAPAPAPAPTQRLRSIAQGATMGGADELEARLRSAVSGETYEQALGDIRGKMKAYQQQAPLEALAYEGLGGVGMAAGATLATGGLAAPATIPRVATSVAPLVKGILGTSALGGAQGGITGFLSGEGDLVERAARVPQSTVMGATLAPAVQLGLMGAGKLTDTVLDSARRLTGGRGGKAVEAEIQRLAGDTGLTTDEIVQRIANGEIMAENQTLLAAVRGLYAQGGQASTTLQKSLTTRPDRLRKEALTDIQKNLVGDLTSFNLGPRPENVLKYFKQSDDAARATERSAYNQAFGQGGVIDAELLGSLTTALKRSPNAVKDINEIYTAQTGKKPFFSVDKKGDINFSKAPTLEDAEIVRRGLQANINTAYTSGRGGVGEALKPVEENLRSAIDASSTTLANARQQAAALRGGRDAFKEGRTVLSKSADEVDVYMDSIADNPAMLSAFRAGTMDAIRKQMGTGRVTSMMSRLANPDSKEGGILRSIYPGDQLDSILTRIGTAAQSQAAKNYVVGQSATASTLLQAQRTGSSITADELANAAGGNPMAGFRVLSKMIKDANTGLSESERQRVAQILTSEDPNIVRNALVDNSAMAALQERLRTLGRATLKSVPYGAGYIGATMPRQQGTGQ
jgi:hypothetical protein